MLKISRVLCALAASAAVLLLTDNMWAQAPLPTRPMSGMKIPVYASTEPTTSKRMVRGMVSLRARIPATVKVKSVSYTLDGKAIGDGTDLPFFPVDWDSKSRQDGECTIVASGKDEAGLEVWSGRVALNIANSAAAPGAGVLLGPAGPPVSGVQPMAGRPGVGAPPLPKPSTLARPGATGGVRGNAIGQPVAPPPVGPGGQPDVFGVELKPYHSDKHKFDIVQPTGALISDKSAAMKPKRPGSFWVIFSMERGGKALYAINVRYQRLESPCTPDKYAKYNPYLLEWERVEVNGLSGFKTTSGLRDTKRVIHRTLLVDGVSVWMLNLTDLTGGDPEISKRMFERIVASLNQSSPEGMPGTAPAPAGVGAPPSAPPNPEMAPAPAEPATSSTDEGVGTPDAGAGTVEDGEPGPPPPD